MKKILFLILSLALLVPSNADAKRKTGAVSLNTGIQEAQAASFDNEDDNDKPKKKKSSKKSKKVKKAKKSSSGN